MTAAFSKLDQVQLSDIRIWRAEFLAPVTKFSRICLYFFSGPDFLYADTFYPDCNTYVLVSLESVESIPELQSVPLASIGGVVAFPIVGLYEATKYAVEAMAEALATEVARFLPSMRSLQVWSFPVPLFS